MIKNKITPLYERLSRDDKLSGDSFSIQNQKSMSLPTYFAAVSLNLSSNG